MDDSIETPLQLYHLYGRKSHAQPLAFVGQVESPPGPGLREEALRLAGPGGWVELIAFAEASILRVLPEGDRP